jgi:hypothetical protein
VGIPRLKRRIFQEERSAFLEQLAEFLIRLLITAMLVAVLMPGFFTFGTLEFRITMHVPLLGTAGTIMLLHSMLAAVLAIMHGALILHLGCGFFTAHATFATVGKQDPAGILCSTCCKGRQDTEQHEANYSWQDGQFMDISHRVLPG